MLLGQPHPDIKGCLSTERVLPSLEVDTVIVDCDCALLASVDNSGFYRHTQAGEAIIAVSHAHSAPAGGPG